MMFAMIFDNLHWLPWWPAPFQAASSHDSSTQDRLAVIDSLRVLATVRFPVIQFNSVQQSFMTFGIVPIAGAQAQ